MMLEFLCRKAGEMLTILPENIIPKKSLEEKEYNFRNVEF